MVTFNSQSRRQRHLLFLLMAFYLFFGPLSNAAAQGASSNSSAEVGASTDTSPSASTIDSVSTPELDNRISERLQGIYSELERFSSVNVSVSNSVVVLSGKLFTADDINEAEQLAAKVIGVAKVDNQLTLETSVTERLDNSIAELTSESRTFLSSLPLYLLALLLVVLSWYLGSWAAHKRNWLLTITPNAFIAELMGNIIRLVILLAGLFIALRLLDATDIIGTVLGAAGIVGLALGFAVRDTVENYIASILLSIRNPFKTRDYVAVDGYEGSVARLTSRATILVSAEGNHIRIPNAIVYKSVITNYSRNPLRRFEFNVGIDSSDDILVAQRIALSALKTVPGVLSDPEGSVTVAQLGDSNTTLLIQAWMDQQVHDLVKVRSETIRLIKFAFDQAGIVMPEPIYRLIVKDASSSAMRTEAPDTRPSPIKSSPESKPAQSLKLDDAAKLTISAELAMSDQDNLLSDTTAHE